MMQQNSIEKRKIKIVKQYYPHLYIYANKTKFMQVLQNLIKNSYESIAMSDNYKSRIIAIKTQHLENNMIRFSISDTGIGIEPDKACKLFDYGYTTKKRGTGFGLHSCKNFITSFHGEIRCYSQGKDKGATFEIDMPGKIKTPSTAQ